MESMGNMKRVLVVDDEPAVALAIKAVLKYCGYGVEMSTSGEAALRQVREAPGKFALVLSDHNMPGISGLDLARELDAMDYPGKVIILSALVSPDMEAEYKKAGVDQIILKPFDLQGFRRAVQSTLESLRRRRLSGPPDRLSYGQKSRVRKRGF